MEARRVMYGSGTGGEGRGEGQPGGRELDFIVLALFILHLFYHIFSNLRNFMEWDRALDG